MFITYFSSCCSCVEFSCGSLRNSGDLGAGLSGCGGRFDGTLIFHDGDCNDVCSIGLKSRSMESKRLKLPVEFNRNSEPE